MKLTKNILIALCSITIISGFLLSSSSVSADDAAVDTINLTIPEACTLSTPTGSGQTYNAQLANGQYKNDIGKTRLTVFCNTQDSFAVYAVGYSNDTIGNSEMITTTSGATNILTGTATSGSDSSWAMKIEAVAGNGTDIYTPTVLNPFDDFTSVPSSYAKIAEVTSATTRTVEGAIDATYQVYISQNQQAGAYTGKVRYTVVHPSTEVPLQPVVTTAGKIGYVPNAKGVIDSMGDQTASSNTEVTLWPSNFKRDGYGFAGWTDKYDWVLNENDANGNGTGANVGYHIYGPSQTITTPDLSTEGMTLYAVWIKSAGSLQNWSGCSSMTNGQVTALTDTRNQNTYAIAKLADGKCWMIENLRLGGTNQIALTSANSNVSSNFTLSASTDPTVNAWCGTDNAACMDQSMLNSTNTTNSVTNMATATLGQTDNNGIYSLGNYYNWYSATAGSGTYSIGSVNNTSVVSSVCPVGWHLPKGGSKSGESNNEYWNLIVTKLNNGTNPANYSSSEYPYYTGNLDGVNASKAIRNYPNNFIYSGYIINSLFNDRGYCAAYWSDTTGAYKASFELLYCSSTVYPGTHTTLKSVGVSVRCIAN